MSNYFSFDYSGEPFKQLGAAHIGALLVILSIVLVTWILSPKDEMKWIMRFSIALLMAINEIFWHAWHAYYGLWNIQSLLPLNICNLMVIIGIWVLITKNQLGYEFLYLLGIPAASQVLITPALGIYGFPHILFFQIFISHGGVVIAALFMTLNEKMRPTSWVSVRRVVILTTFYVVIIFILNSMIGSNYLFLAYKPPAATLLDYLGPWPWYIMSMEAIGIIFVILLYLPFHRADKSKSSMSY